MPRTPALAIWVVLVITDVDDAPPGEDPAQPLHSATKIATVAGAAAGRIRLNSTGPTLTFGCSTPSTTVCRTTRSAGAAER